MCVDFGSNGMSGIKKIEDNKMIILRQNKLGKTPSPAPNKKNFIEFDGYKVKIQNKNIFRDVPVKAVY